jgi:probable selenium-dependent hydroxylase accessory protein YqeC
MAERSLLDALSSTPGHLIALVGAGGKTSLLYRLAAEARARGLRVLLTTSTHLGSPPAGVPLLLDEGTDLEVRLATALDLHGVVLLAGRVERPDKLAGLPPERVDTLARLADLTVVEADGARGGSLKLPADHEPVVPRSAGLVVVVAALDVLGQPLDGGLVHRLDVVRRATGAGTGTIVDAALVTRALAHPAGYLARVPTAARLAAFLNKAEDASGLAAAEQIAAGLPERYALVLAGSARG